MSEREMGDRGSKSDSKISVKEQRVDDSWHNLLLCLRCTIMGF